MAGDTRSTATVQRTVEQRTPCRRIVRGTGGALPDKGDRLVMDLRDGTAKLWRALRGRPPGHRPEAEAFVWAMVDAGAVEIEEVRDRRGDWRPVRYRLTAEAFARLAEVRERRDRLRADAAAVLAAWPTLSAEARAHPVLQAISAWLGRELGAAPAKLLRTVLAVARYLVDGRTPQERVLAVELFGNSKALRDAALRERLSAVFDRPVEEVVRRHAAAALAYGDFSFQIGGRRIDGLWSVPWLAVTEETIGAMVDARVGDPRLVTIENQTCFEAYVREGLPDGGIAVWTGGFLGEVERELIAHLVGAGVERILHWGDLDPDGLAILEHVARSVGVPVEPLRMEPRLLDRLPGRPLTDRDVRLLEARIAAGGPYAELAAAMQRTGVKVEQEAWYLEREG